MQHLVRRDVIQHEADSLGCVQPRWHRNEFTLRQADELRVCTAYRQRGNYLAWLDPRDTLAEPIHHANQIPPRREGQRGVLINRPIIAPRGADLKWMEQVKCAEQDWTG